MRRTGATIVVTRACADAWRASHTGAPGMRFYLVTFRPDDPALRPCVQLQHHLVEVCYVTCLRKYSCLARPPWGC